MISLAFANKTIISGLSTSPATGALNLPISIVSFEAVTTAIQLN